MTLGPGPDVIKLFYVRNLPMFVQSQNVCSLQAFPAQSNVRPKPILMKHLSSAPLQGRLLALPTSIRIIWKGKPVKNTLAYYKKFINYGRKKNYDNGPRSKWYETFLLCCYFSRQISWSVCPYPAFLPIPTFVCKTLWSICLTKILSKLSLISFRCLV